MFLFYHDFLQTHNKIIKQRKHANGIRRHSNCTDMVQDVHLAIFQMKYNKNAQRAFLRNPCLSLAIDEAIIFVMSGSAQVR